MWYKVQFLNSLRPLGTSLFGRKDIDRSKNTGILQTDTSNMERYNFSLVQFFPWDLNEVLHNEIIYFGKLNCESFVNSID